MTSSDLLEASRWLAVAPPCRARQLVADRDGRRPWLPRWLACSLRVWVERTTRLSGIEGLGGLLHAVGVDLGRDLDARAALADDAGHQLLDLLFHAPLEALLLFLQRGRAARLALGAVGQQASALVDDRDLVGLQAFHGGGDEMADRAHLARVELAGHLQRDGGAGLLAVALEQLALGDDEMDPRRLDAREGPDGAGELAFQRAQRVDVLHEAGGREGVALVEDLVADAAARWACPCRRDPCAAWRCRPWAPSRCGHRRAACS